MHRWLAAGMVMAGMVATPGPSIAEMQQKSLVRCLNEAVQSCDADFEGNDVYMAAVRGYCYMIRGAICYAAEPQ